MYKLDGRTKKIKDGCTEVKVTFHDVYVENVKIWNEDQEQVTMILDAMAEDYKDRLEFLGTEKVAAEPEMGVAAEPEMG